MLYIVPSRGRPDNIRALIQSFAETRTRAALWVCVDDDDPTLPGYRELDFPREWATLFVGPRKRLGPTLNEYAALYSNLPTEGDKPNIVGFMGDDHRPRTHGWDAQIAEAFSNAGGTAVVYGNDLIQGPNLPTAVAMSTDIVSALGYMVPPGLVHLHIDNAWGDIGRELGKFVYLPNVIIEHCHPIAQKGVEWDAGYIEVNSKAVWDADEIVYKEWAASSEWRTILKGLTV